MHLDLENIIANPERHPELYATVTQPGIENSPNVTSGV